MKKHKDAPPAEEPEILELVDLEDGPPAAEETEPESSSRLTSSDASLLAEYKRRADEAEAALALVSGKLAELTSQPAAAMPWEDAENRVVYWHEKHAWSTFNPVTGQGLDFQPLFGGGSEYRTDNPREIEWLDSLSDPNSRKKKPGLLRLTPRPSVEV